MSAARPATFWAASLGVVTMSTSVRGSILARPIWTSPVPGGRSITQVVEGSPADVLEEVLDGPVEHQAAPHDRLVLAGEEAHRDDLQQTRADDSLEGDHLARRAPRAAPSIPSSRGTE